MSKKPPEYKTVTYKPPEHIRMCKYCETEIWNQLDHIECPKLYRPDQAGKS